MFGNFIKFALRHFLRNRGITFINILGLAIGIAVFILIMMYVNHEYRYDDFNSKSDRIYRMEFGEWCVLPPGIGHHLAQQDIPEIEKVVRFLFTFSKPLIKYYEEGKASPAREIKLEQLAFADSAIFDVFDLRFARGNKKTTFPDPYSILITEKTALKLFGKENPVGKILNVNNQYDVRVTGVLQDQNDFHLVYDAILPMAALEIARGKGYVTDMNSSNFPTYLLLNDNSSTGAVIEKIRRFFKDHYGDNITEEELGKWDIQLRPLKEIYFFKDAQYEAGAIHGNPYMVNIYIVIAVFILLIAAFNFINLSTARSIQRAREIGMKKVLGGQREQLIIQFLAETVLLTFFAAVLAIVGVEVFINDFNNLAGTEISLEYNVTNLFYFFTGLILLGILAGIYPAFYLTKFKAVTVLKGKQAQSVGSGTLRKILILIQFSISIILIIGTILIYKQLHFVRNKSLGFNKDHVVSMTLEGRYRQSREVFKSNLLQNPNVLGVTYGHGVPGFVMNQESYQWDEEEIQMTVTSVDPDYFDVFDIKMKSGRNFSDELETDKLNTCIINETAAKRIGWDNPVGKRVNRDTVHGYSVFNNGSFEVIGVVEDFHYESLHKPIGPLAIGYNPNWFWHAAIRIAPDNIPQTLTYIEKQWEKFNPDYPFDYTFIDQSFDKMYKKEEKLGRLFSYFTLLGVFIACMGLFGLASFITLQRTKEIGIRKVMGASAGNIVSLLSTEFSKLVLIANVIAWPLAWFALDKWLDNFAYQTTISWWIFALSGLIAFVIAFATIAWQAWKAALTNPVNALKYE